MAKLRAGVVVAPMLAVLVVGCSSDSGGSGDDELTLPSTSPTPTGATDEPTDDAAADISAVEQLHAAYWEALVGVENGGDLDPGSFAGIATDAVIEQDLSRIDSIRGSGHQREGEPVIDNVTVTVDEDEARIESCVNEDDWILVADGEEVPLDKEGPTPRVVIAERTDGAWLISNFLSQEEATLTC
jgi:hypothetical protein